MCVDGGDGILFVCVRGEEKVFVSEKYIQKCVCICEWEIYLMCHRKQCLISMKVQRGGG